MNRRSILKSLAALPALIFFPKTVKANTRPMSILDVKGVAKHLKDIYGNHIANIYITTKQSGKLFLHSESFFGDDGEILHIFNDPFPIGSYQVKSQEAYIKDAIACIESHAQDEKDVDKFPNRVDVVIFLDINRGFDYVGCTVCKHGRIYIKDRSESVVL